MIGQDQIVAVLIVFTQTSAVESCIAGVNADEKRAGRIRPQTRQNISVPYPGSINRLSLDR